MVWTDPPYGVSYADKNKFLNATDRGNRIQTPIHDDHSSPEQVRRLFRFALRVAVAHADIGMTVYATVPGGPLFDLFVSGLKEAGISYRHQLVWVKQQFVIGMSDYHHRHEPILYGWLENGPHYWSGDRSQDSVFQINKPHVSDLHPTTKPVELIARMIVNSSRAGEVVYDPFCGSGSTLLAAHQLARIGYGCELDVGYAAVTLERFAQLGVIGKLIN
jgi:DNA modification methylase